MAAKKQRSFVTTLQRDGAMCHIAVPFDPAPVFGKARAPVKVTLNGYTFRSTIFTMGEERFVPLRKSNREAANLAGTETLSITLTLDEEERTVSLPPDALAALDASPAAKAAWEAASFTRRREHADAIEEAKKPETRARRIDKMLSTLLGGRPAILYRAIGSIDDRDGVSGRSRTPAGASTSLGEGTAPTPRSSATEGIASRSLSRPASGRSPRG